jgi:cyclohexanecarboxylate-CoA ligase
MSTVGPLAGPGPGGTTGIRSRLGAYDPPFPGAWSAECRRRGFWRDEILLDHVLAQADRHPAGIAVADSGGSYRYDELAAETLAVAGGLHQRGVEPGDVVLVALPPVRQFVPVILAAERLGAVVASVMPALGPLELSRIVGLAQPRVVVTVAAFRRHRPAEVIMSALARQAVSATMIIVGTAGARPAVAENVALTGYGSVSADARSAARQLPDPPGGDALASLAFTTGSSGEPKGVLHTRNTSMLAIRSTAERQGLGEEDVFHAALPVGHTFGYFYGVRLGFSLAAVSSCNQRGMRTRCSGWPASTASPTVPGHQRTWPTWYRGCPSEPAALHRCGYSRVREPGWTPPGRAGS